MEIPMRSPLSGLSALLVLAALTAPAPAYAQTELIPLDRVRQLYVAGEPRDAARTLGAVSAEFRQEIGRCKDPEIGAKLIELEPRIDALVSRLGNGRVANERELTEEFAVIDQLLAENHLQLAELGWSLRRFGNVDAMGRDLDLAARYAERSARWAHRPLDAEARSAIDAARATAARIIATPAQPPADTERSLEALSTVVKRQP
jgi:hypothetical protein